MRAEWYEWLGLGTCAYFCFRRGYSRGMKDLIEDQQENFLKLQKNYRSLEDEIAKKELQLKYLKELNDEK